MRSFFRIHSQNYQEWPLPQAEGGRASRAVQPEQSKPLLADAFGGGEPGFYHGVASGDPLPDSIILWTRYTPYNVSDEIPLEFRIAAIDLDSPLDYNLLDPSNNPNLKRGTVVVTASSDWIAKIDVKGLPSSTHFVYAFTDGKNASDVGLTRTAPAPNEETELVYAFFSCSHFGYGYFHSYDIASTIQDLDLYFHLGDFIYVSELHRAPAILKICQQLYCFSHF